MYFGARAYDGTSLSEFNLKRWAINKTPACMRPMAIRKQLFLKAIEFYENSPCSLFYRGP